MPHNQEPSPPEKQTSESETDKGLRYYQEAADIYSQHIAQNADASTIEQRAEFEAAYVGSFDDSDDFVHKAITDLGWFRILHAATDQGGIPPDTLRINYNAVFGYLARYFHIYYSADAALHVFSKAGIAPMKPDLTSGGQL